MGQIGGSQQFHGHAQGSGAVGEVWVIPTGGHPFGKDLAPFEDRLQMCRLAFACYGARARVLDLERGEGVHYSIDTARRLKSEHPARPLRWIIGADAYAERGAWKDFDALAALAPPLVVGRAGYPSHGSGFMLPDVNSTLIREMLARGEHAELEGLVPASVLAYIRARGLYRRR